jgi:hypothetical protein
MELPLFRILEHSSIVVGPGELVGEAAHEKAAGAYMLKYSIPDGYVIFTIWQDRLHEVIYQTPAEDERTALGRNAVLFKHYGEGHAFNEVLDNGFGKTYRRADMKMYALWGYMMDIMTIGSMEFHAVKWG